MVSKEEYLNYMQQNPTRSGYATSPIFQQGLERWDPEGGVMGLGNVLASSTSNFLGKNIGDIRGSNWGNKYVSTDASLPVSGNIPGTPLANTDYNPEAWGEEFGHEISHGGWDYNPLTLEEEAIGRKSDDEEIFNRMHDYMYGNWQMESAEDHPLRRYGWLAGKGYYDPRRFSGGKQIGTGNWTETGMNAIRDSNLVDWQKGMLLQGPVAGAGQIALGQRPDQVRAQGQAYMDPNRGNVQTPRMTSSQIRQEADRTGGTRHAGEMTQAAGRVRTQPVRGPHGYQAGGSVNPFEETAQAARDWSPREQYISRSNLPSYRAERSDNVPDYFNKPYTPSDNIPDPYPLGDNSGIMSFRNKPGSPGYRTSADNPNSLLYTDWFGIGGHDFAKKRAPEYLGYFQDIMDKDAMARDTNYQVTLPENEKLGKLSSYKLLPEGVYPYGNPSWIENDPSYGLDYMTDLWGGKGRVGFRKGLYDDEWNAYANWGIEL